MPSDHRNDQGRQRSSSASGWAEGMSRFATASSDVLATVDVTWFKQHWKPIVWGFVLLLLLGPALAVVGLLMGWLP